MTSLGQVLECLSYSFSPSQELIETPERNHRSLRLSFSELTCHGHVHNSSLLGGKEALCFGAATGNAIHGLDMPLRRQAQLTLQGRPVYNISCAFSFGYTSRCELSLSCLDQESRKRSTERNTRKMMKLRPSCERAPLNVSNQWYNPLSRCLFLTALTVNKTPSS